MSIYKNDLKPCPTCLDFYCPKGEGGKCPQEVATQTRIDTLKEIEEWAKKNTYKEVPSNGFSNRKFVHCGSLLTHIQSLLDNK